MIFVTGIGIFDVGFDDDDDDEGDGGESKFDEEEVSESEVKEFEDVGEEVEEVIKEFDEFELEFVEEIKGKEDLVDNEGGGGGELEKFEGVYNGRVGERIWTINFTISEYPLEAANARGVLPWESLEFKEAPFWINNSRISILPVKQLKWTHVWPLESRRLITSRDLWFLLFYYFVLFYFLLKMLKRKKLQVCLKKSTDWLKIS